MSLPQTSINPNGMPRGMAGDLADTDPNNDVVSAFNTEASAEIAFGTAVQFDGAQGAKVLSSSSDHIKGVAVRDLNHVVGGTGVGDLGTIGLLPKAGFGVMRKGRILAQLDAGESSLTPGTSRGYARYETDGSGNTVVGRWGSSSDGHNIDCTKQTVFVSDVFTFPDGTKGAVLEVDFTNKP